MAKTVVIGMSGGVDSSVSAWLLKQQGYEVVGLFMKNWEDDDDSEYCSSRQDLIDAVSVADTIGIDIEHVNFAKEYKERVFAEFLQEYSAGRTPNPDILCNAEIKFKAFLDHAFRMGADYIATGHYARVQVDSSSGEAFLLKGKDSSKDQSYFLHRLQQHQLQKTLFPLGELHKTHVRQIALDLGLSNAQKKDSTGICFIGERPFREFLNRYIPKEPGDICLPDGTVIGQHMGLAFYTLGQRKGLGVGGIKGMQSPQGEADAWYVAKKDMRQNRLYVVQGHTHPWLLQSDVTVDNVAWVGNAAPELQIPYAAKTRYRQADAPCSVALNAQKQWVFSFESPQWAVTPGQSAVLYQGDFCLGGGIIHDTPTSVEN